MDERARYLEWVHRTHGGWIKHEERYSDGTTPGEAFREWEELNPPKKSGTRE